MFNLMRILILVLALVVTIILVVNLSEFFAKVKKEAEEESKKREKGTTVNKWVLDKLRKEPKNIISRLLKVGAGVIVGLLALVIIGQIYWFVVLGLLATFIPGLIANKVHKSYMDKFNAQFIDGLTLITNAMRAGASFPQALELMVAEAKPPLSEIFGETLREFKLGVPMG
ncbi:MAG: hypothetical protein GX817_03355, partial [Elusimicrobia bacterium]|nr:hypothetical protein [Elusimicrobiota bacterium]